MRLTFRGAGVVTATLVKTRVTVKKLIFHSARVTNEPIGKEVDVYPL